ncbi:MAG: DUF4112 domain-containing protein [Rhodospirillaceae bacterium]
MTPEAPYPPPVYRGPPEAQAPEAQTPEAQAKEEHDLTWLAGLLDSRWRIPGTNWRFGVDAIAGLVPGAGDLVAGLAGLYILSAAARAGVPKHVMARMIGNIAVDTIVGSIPILGGIFDIFYKSNKKNLALYAKHKNS